MDFGKGGGKLLTLTYESTPVGQAPAVEPSLYRASLRPVASMDPPQAPDELALLLKRIVTTLPPETHALVLRHLPTPELARLSCVHNAFGVAWRSLQQQHGGERYAPPSVDDFKAVKGLSRLERAAAFGDVAVIRSMVAAGVDKDRVVDKSLSHAAKHGYLQAVELLLAVGANVHAFDDKALRDASERGHVDVLRLLLQAGANVHACNDHALWHASHYGRADIVQIHLLAGADVHACDDRALRDASINGHVDVVRLLLQAGANVHARYDEALRWASIHGHATVVQLLLHAGADVHARNS